MGGGGGSPCVELASEMTYAGLHSEAFQAAWGCIWLGIKGGSQGVLLEHDYTPPFKALEGDVGAALRMSSAFSISGRACLSGSALFLGCISGCGAPG